MEVYSRLTDPELWNMRPAEIASLTDWQIQWLYFHPVATRDRKDKPAPVEDPFKDGLPPRGQFIALMMGTDGGTPERWNADYDRLEAEIKARG